MIIEKLGIQFHLIVKYSKVIRKYRKDFIFYLLVIVSVIRVFIGIPLSLYNQVFLNIRKKRKRIFHPIIHLYAITWNEEKILPFVLDYYNRFVDKIILYDNQSTDKTREIASGYSKVQIIEFNTNNTFDDITHTKIKNECWKHSRGKADYVIVCDIDELLYCENIHGYFKCAIKSGYTFFTTKGYNMYSDAFPNYDSKKLITEIVNKGIFNQKYSKSIVFNPNYIFEVNFSPGSHICYPWGIVTSPQSITFMLLHFKNLGLEYVLNKQLAYSCRFSEENINNNFGVEYMNDNEFVVSEFQKSFPLATKVI